MDQYSFSFDDSNNNDLFPEIMNDTITVDLTNDTKFDYETGHYNNCDWLKRPLHNKILNKQRIPCKCSLTKNKECSALICSQSCLELINGILYGECYDSWKKTCKINIFDPCLCRCLNELCDEKNISIRERNLISPENFDKVLKVPYNYGNNHLSEKRIKKSFKNKYESESSDSSIDYSTEFVRTLPNRKAKHNTNIINRNIMRVEDNSSSEYDILSSEEDATDESFIESNDYESEDDSYANSSSESDEPNDSNDMEILTSFKTPTMKKSDPVNYDKNTNVQPKRKFSFVNNLNKPFKKPRKIDYNSMGTCFSESSEDES